MTDKTAVILFNLGAPDSLAAVRPFLFNLFSDRAIIDYPWFFRMLLAWVISWRRSGEAKKIYRRLGGKSPLLENSISQAKALEDALIRDRPEGFIYRRNEVKTFVCMRYWHPMSMEVAQMVKEYNPDRIILLPLYPHYSITTTGSSFADWDESAAKVGLDVDSIKINSYFNDNRFIAAHMRGIMDTYWLAAEYGRPRILFSAHGLPQKIIDSGDPYQSQIEDTVSAIVDVLNLDDIDYSICYQSRVGRLKWLEPDIDSEIIRAGKDKVPVVVVPVSFVSEHSETLVELDIKYRKLAEDSGVCAYFRVDALGTIEEFIESLAYLCKHSCSGK